MNVEAAEGKIKELTAASATEFWRLLSPETPLFSGRAEILYRGQADAKWELLPGLFRNNPALAFGLDWAKSSAYQIAAEWMVLDRFVTHCDATGLPIPEDSREFRAKCLSQDNLSSFARRGSLWPDERFFDLMALAQHHGLPTRLLDWSKRSYVAAYFAASDALTRHLDGVHAERFAVWALNIETMGPEMEIVRIPGSNNPNIAAQAGTFSLLRQTSMGRCEPLQGTVKLDAYLRTQPQCPLVKVTIPVDEAAAVIRLCEKHAITAATLFPDYYGAARATMDVLRCERQARAI